MARNKDPEFKQHLWSFRKKRLRAPTWAIAKSKKRLMSRFAKVHWRRTDFGRRIRRLIE